MAGPSSRRSAEEVAGWRWFGTDESAVSLEQCLEAEAGEDSVLTEHPVCC